MAATELHRAQRTAQPSRVCESCGETFTRSPGSHETHAKFSRRRYCSAECARRRPRKPLADRFNEKIHRDPEGCWHWGGTVDPSGYGVISVGAAADGLLPAHVVAYELTSGPIPEGLVLDHLCRNPRCVRPDHLEPVTSAENARRGAKAKITQDDALTIRKLVQGGMSQRSVARRFRLHPSHICRIVNEKRWRSTARPVTRKRRVG